MSKSGVKTHLGTLILSWGLGFMLLAKWCALFMCCHWVVGNKHTDRCSLSSAATLSTVALLWLSALDYLHNSYYSYPASDTHIAFHHTEHFSLWGSSPKYLVVLAYVHWIRFSISVGFFCCILQLHESKYVEKIHHPNWSFFNSSQFPPISPSYCSWDGLLHNTQTKAMHLNWTMYDSQTCGCNMEGHNPLLQSLEHTPGSFLSCLSYYKDIQSHAKQQKVNFSYEWLLKPMVEGQLCKWGYKWCQEAS